MTRAAGPAKNAARLFGDAVAFFPAGRGPSAGLKVNGAVDIGVELQGEERAASLKRGGDGTVADFKGGYLVSEAANPLACLNGSKAMTLCMRLRDAAGAWRSSLLSLNNPFDPFAGLLYGRELDRGSVASREAARLSSDRQLEYRWRSDRLGIGPGDWGVPLDFWKGVLRVDVPVDLIRPAAWHDVIVRFTGPRLELFVDGVRVDEEWPYGAIDGMSGELLIGAGFDKGLLKSDFRGQVDHVAFWNRALADDEIVALSGGREEVARRDAEILGPEDPEAQYWRPRGWNTYVGDVMLFFHDGRLHVYYLFDRRHCGSKWGTGAHQWAHMSSRDLVHWDHHPMALPITDQTESSLGTGSFVFHDGRYYLYYIQHGKRLTLADAKYRGDNVFMATSRDGIHFEKDPQPVAILNYMGGDINPHVITAESGDRYFMTLSGRVYTSGDLVSWAETSMPPLSAIRWICTDDFRMGEWRYFTGEGFYVMSRKPIEDTREWVQPSSQGLRDWLGVPVVSEFTGSRRIYAGFIGGRGEWPYAQELVFREVVQEKDGTLGLKWPEEMIPKSGEALPLAFAPMKGQADIRDGGVSLSAPNGFACAVATGLPRNVRISLRVRPRAGILHFGLCCRGKGNYEEGCELRFEPAGQRMQYGRPVAGESGLDARTTVDMSPVPGLDGEFTLEMIVKDSVVDACVGSRRTLITKNAQEGDRLFLFVRNGEAVFEDLTVRPLRHPW